MVRTHDAADGQVTETHAKRADDQEGTAPGLVDEDSHDAGEDDEDGVLDARGHHGDVALKAGHLCDVGEIVPANGQYWSLMRHKGVAAVAYTMMLAPASCCHAWTVIPAMVRFHMPFLMNFLHPGPASCSARMTVTISSHSAMTRGS